MHSHSRIQAALEPSDATSSTVQAFSDVDLSVVKTTRITERVRAQLRAELFNVFNRVNLGNPTFLGANLLIPAGPGVNFTLPITSTNGEQFGLPGIGPGEPFNAQLALKLIF
jgi:tetrahydromethanopterin S-methyltransferase subunit H